MPCQVILLSICSLSDTSLESLKKYFYAVLLVACNRQITRGMSVFAQRGARRAGPEQHRPQRGPNLLAEGDKMSGSNLCLYTDLMSFLKTQNRTAIKPANYRAFQSIFRVANMAQEMCSRARTSGRIKKIIIYLESARKVTYTSKFSLKKDKLHFPEKNPNYYLLGRICSYAKQ